MKNLNLYFVGYFLSKDDKMKYVNLFDCKNKFFLESSFPESLQSKESKYLPELLYKNRTQFKHIFNREKIIINSLVKELYKRDIRHFKASDINLKKIKKLKLLLLILFFSINNFYRTNKGILKLNIFNYLKQLLILVKNYKKKNNKFIKKLKKFIFKTNFIFGYKYSINVLNNLSYNKNDIFILWGKSYSSRILLIHYLKKNNVPYYISEYGEVPGTISCSPNGIFGEIFSQSTWNEFCEKKITKNDIDYTKNILDNIIKNQISTRNSDSNMFFLMKYFYDNSVKKDRKNRKKIVYVNGSELFSSGLYHNRWNINNGSINPNKMMLKQVISHFNNNEYLIIYKEHPMAFKQSKNALLNKSDFPTVNFIKNMNIHDILEISDIIVTFPSKVVILSLLYKKATFVLGDFTIPTSIPSINYFTGNKFENIFKMYTSKKEIDNDKFIEILARLIKYSLIIYDDKLYYKYSQTSEKNKLKTLLSS